MTCKIESTDEGNMIICDLSKNKCESGGECDTDGDTLLFNDKGEYFKCTEDSYTEDFFKKHEIRGSCSSCSKCGKPFTPPMFDFWA